MRSLSLSLSLSFSRSLAILALIRDTHRVRNLSAIKEERACLLLHLRGHDRSEICHSDTYELVEEIHRKAAQSIADAISVR
jgi:hypothetical protein